MGSALKNSKNFNLINAIYIDWNYHLSKFEQYIASPKFIYDDIKFEDKLDIVDSYMKIRDFYSSDNMDDFIEFYTNNRNIFSKIGELNND